ncbi:MAG: carboxypeptidase-like regulatory domain-containing protein [Candidatus Brocadiaceae bacterium]|uniref:carboxypeptidase regulatory-like domain-containing protein n=1 Tax=Candidatus Wunengus sp. YC61 TaxID=3367698 RepID=UPI00271AA875|nr:carboxypeptidase-like regulatory domain-containing protein [Candidatus Brocadiaceae bacterium]
MIRKKHGIIFLFLNIIFMLGISAEVVTAENIDPDNDDSQYAYGENVGYLNFEPGGNGGSGAEVTNSAVTGYVWGENIGWINLSPTSYGGVANDGAGNLSGYAWGENVGWINFAPTYGGVTIGTDGVFDGWAWGENIGWIHLKNLAIPYKVKTAWAPLSTTPTPTPSSTLTPTPTTTPTTSPVGTGTVFGWVEDVDGEPLKGVTVSIKGSAFSDSTETDEDGYYEFGGLLKGNYTITYELEGYRTQTQDISLNEGEEKDLDITTLEQIETGEIFGNVVNIVGDPLESVSLSLKGIKTKVKQTTSSDEDGFFEFTDLEADTYIISAKNKGYRNTQQKVKLKEGESKEMEIVMKKKGKGK